MSRDSLFWVLSIKYLGNKTRVSGDRERERDGSASPRWRNLFPIAPGSDGWQNGDRERQLATGKYQFPSGQNHFTVLHFFFLPVFQKQQLYSLWCTFGVGPPLKGKREKRERGLDGRDVFLDVVREDISAVECRSDVGDGIS